MLAYNGSWCTRKSASGNRQFLRFALRPDEVNVADDNASSRSAPAENFMTERDPQ